jgi:hypothetical protein
MQRSPDTPEYWIEHYTELADAAKAKGELSSEGYHRRNVQFWTKRQERLSTYHQGGSA